MMAVIAADDRHRLWATLRTAGSWQGREGAESPSARDPPRPRGHFVESPLRISTVRAGSDRRV